MKTTSILLAIASFVISFLTGCKENSTAHIPAVTGLDLPRYMGKWYEIARLPNWFQRDLRNVTAEYTLRPDGTVHIRNCGYKNGRQRCVEGTAYPVGEPGSGELEVTFQKPFRGAYRIIYLEPDHSLAAVTGSDRDLLWILARTPEISAEKLESLTAWLREKGFETERLIR